MASCDPSELEHSEISGKYYFKICILLVTGKLI